MRRALPALAALLLAAGCGGDDGDDEPDAGGATGATGFAGTELTAGEFLAELRPQKQRILEPLVAESEACVGVTVDPSFVLLVSAAAAEAAPDTSLAAVVEERCAGG